MDVHGTHRISHRIYPRPPPPGAYQPRLFRRPSLPAWVGVIRSIRLPTMHQWHTTLHPLLHQNQSLIAKKRRLPPTLKTGLALLRRRQQNMATIQHMEVPKQSPTPVSLDRFRLHSHTMPLRRHRRPQLTGPPCLQDQVHMDRPLRHTPNHIILRRHLQTH